MVRFLGSLALLGCLTAVSYGQSPSPTAGSALAAVAAASPTANQAKLEDLRHSFEQLSPDQQQKFLQNYHRWEDLTPEEREILRQRQRMREKKRDEDTAEAYQKSGLKLNEDQRERFRRRYQQERRKMEEQLLKETQERRQAGNAAIVEQLKKEFSTPLSPPGR
ncbi:MAG TPA: hypothetical protein VGD78_18895 [Chthoniobacterales bacterium]